MESSFHPPAHILICTGGYALWTNPDTAQYGGIISFLRTIYPAKVKYL